jgi:hypothetical protein
MSIMYYIHKLWKSFRRGMSGLFEPLREYPFYLIVSILIILSVIFMIKKV